MAKILKVHAHKRIEEPDILLGILSRSDVSLADELAWFLPQVGWQHITTLPGTDLLYDTVSWRNSVYIADGKNPIFSIVVEPIIAECAEVANSPIVQYLVVFQDRLVGAGDARTKAEVIADGQVWPADSNRDRVIFTEVLEDTEWTPNNFIDAHTGTGQQVKGLAVNSINTATVGAQSQLVVAKDNSVLVNNGILNTGDQKLDVLSAARGLPAYKTLVNTPYGLIGMAEDTVILLKQDGTEPVDIGQPAASFIRAIPVTLRQNASAIYHDETYKLSFPDEDSTAKNTRELWLDLRQGIFPNEHNWYGAHTGDEILEYADPQEVLVGAQDRTNVVWALDVEGRFKSMTDQVNARISLAKTPNLHVDNMKQESLDAYGVLAELVPSTELEGTVEIDRGVASQVDTWTSPSTGTVGYDVTRPIKRPGHEASIQFKHDQDSDVKIHALYLRSRIRGRQSEKQTGSTQA